MSESTQNSVNQTQEDDDYNDDIGNRITQESMEYYVVVFKVGASIQDGKTNKATYLYLAVLLFQPWQ